MTTNELRELDAWIAENVMGYQRTSRPDELTTDAAMLFWHRPATNTREAVLVGRAYSHRGLTEQYGKEMFSHSWTFYAPTTDPAAAMEVLKKCLEQRFISIGRTQGSGYLIAIHTLGDVLVDAPNLELAICLFAKNLFGGSNEKA
jgi:hypothetical protein